MLGWTALGGGWHHARWNWVDANDIAHWANSEGSIVRLRGTISDDPFVAAIAPEDRPPWSKQEWRTSATFRARQLATADGLQAVTGSLRLSIDGQLSELRRGDELLVLGRLQRLSGPRNPGDFDWAAQSRATGIHARLRVDGSAAVLERIASTGSLVDRLGRWRDQLRTKILEQQAQRLSPAHVDVASSLLLGGRQNLNPEIRRDFAESGLLHVLAISGFNIGLLWLWCLASCRAMGLAPRNATLLSMAGILVYTLLTDGNPPVLRATTVALCAGGAELLSRSRNTANTFAAAWLVLLALNPHDIFDLGAQLSYLSVATIALTLHQLQLRWARQDQERDPAKTPLTFGGTLRRALWRRCVESYWVTFLIWIVTAPLAAAQFHLLAPIGLLINLVSAPGIFLLMWVGYAQLLLGLVHPWLAAPFAWAFDWGVAGLLRLVNLAADHAGGHWYVAGPPTWWLGGFYLLVLHAMWQARLPMFNLTRCATRGLGWSALGLFMGLLPAPSTGLSCTVLSVGHGLAIVLKNPDGRVWFYDAGALTQSRRVVSTVEHQLWTSGQHGFAAAVLSHADADHCNALPALADRHPIGALLFSRGFIDFRQPAVVQALTAASRGAIPPKIVAAGDTLELHPEVRITVLHPPPDYRATQDNEHSVVLLIEYASRRLLLTGDLERRGLERLLSLPPTDVDVLITPHHGNRGANPRELAQWCQPETVISSTPDATTSARLRTVYGTAADILSTADRGAITVTISPDGRLVTTGFLVSP